jgi:hypothetical protein
MQLENVSKRGSRLPETRDRQMLPESMLAMKLSYSYRSGAKTIQQDRW